MPESTLPLLVGNSIADVGIEYVELLKIEADPNEVIYIGDIRIDINDTTTKPLITIRLNGVQYLKDFSLISATTTFGFGRNFKCNNDKKPLVIHIKKSTGALNASAFVTGIRKPLKT